MNSLLDGLISYWPVYNIGWKPKEEETMETTVPSTAAGPGVAAVADVYGFNVSANESHVYHHTDREPSQVKIEVTKYQKGERGWKLETRAETVEEAVRQAIEADRLLSATYAPAGDDAP